jgi:hypothetical protein
MHSYRRFRPVEKNPDAIIIAAPADNGALLVGEPRATCGAELTHLETGPDRDLEVFRNHADYNNQQQRIVKGERRGKRD